MAYFYSHGEREKGPALITPWTIIHCITGVIAAVIAKTFVPHLGFLKAFTLYSLGHLAYEIKDLILKDSSFLNGVGDQYFAMWVFVLVYLVPSFTPLTCGVLTLLLLLIFMSPLTGREWVWLTDSWSNRG